MVKSSVTYFLLKLVIVISRSERAGLDIINEYNALPLIVILGRTEKTSSVAFEPAIIDISSLKQLRVLNNSSY